MVPTLINGEWTILLPEHRAARPEWLIENGGWEVARLAHMRATTKPGDVVYYIGGEEGDMAGLLATWGAKLVIAEPNERVWPNIKAIWDANQLPMPEAMYVGFCGDKLTADTTRGLSYFKWPDCAEGEVIGDHGFKELCDPGERPIITIDELSWEIGPPDMISMDVEGSEWAVLQGAEGTLREWHPRIYLSLHPESLALLYNKYSAEVRKWIIDLGYRETLLEWPLHEAHLVYEPA
jgi:FkbM family methyltransferase